jgi:UDP-N-acetylmuramoyl-tripeptide--D-alanyl-D-alanine ligase
VDAVLLIGVIWLIGACLRNYRQAHYYQIEEYMGRRYLRWLLAERGRWLHMRPVLAWFISVLLTLTFSETGNLLLTGLAPIVGAVVGSWPPRTGEMKKPFRPTSRAKRLLGASFLLTPVILWVLFAVSGEWLGSLIPPEWMRGPLNSPNGFDPVARIEFIRVAGISTIGLILFLFAPLVLVAGNIMMMPVEAILRRQFIQQARRVLADVHPVVIGITGSYGKTSTKTYLAQILGGRYRVLATPKSYNTLMGVTLTINTQLANDYSVDCFVTEMGAYMEGEIAEICDLTHPQIGVVVEVGPQHLERFGSLENTARAKYELIKALPADGVGVFNWDNPYVREMYERGHPKTRLAVSKAIRLEEVPQNGPRFIASDIQDSLEGLRFTITDIHTGESEPFATTLLGQHNVTNVLLATAVAVHEGMSLKEVARRVKMLQPAESRLVRQVTAQGITIINDAYSANPVGVEEALRVLGMHTPGKRLLITPGMVELGALMERENKRLGEIAAQYASDVILVGKERTKPIQSGLLEAGFPSDHLQVVETLAESVRWYQNNLRAGDTVLFLNDLPDTY